MQSCCAAFWSRRSVCRTATGSARRRLCRSSLRRHTPSVLESVISSSRRVIARRDVPFFRYPHVFAQHRAEVERALLGAAQAGAYILQADLRAFEDELAAFCGVRCAVGVGNATDGLELNLRVAGVGPGSEVLLPAHTFVATAEAVVAVGATPVFAEIGPDHLIDASDLEHRITPRTRAIMPTQLNGRTADMETIGAIAQHHGLAVVEDSARGLGSRFCGRMAGTFGVAGVSFQFVAHRETNGG